MAHSEHLITSLSEIPPLVHAFATSLGFVVSGTTSNPEIRHPNYMGAGPGGLIFRMSVSLSGVNHDLIWQSTATVGGATPTARLRSPIFATNAAPTVALTQTPTKVHLIGMMAAEPFMAAVVEYGYNLYRHLYVGFMEKIGNYEGGEVVSSQNGPVVTSASANLDILSRSTKNHLFSGRQSLWNPAVTAGGGGVHVLHADNAATWRHFYNPRALSGNIDSAVFDGTEVLGGYGDSINDPLIARGLNRFAGVDVLTPVNLYASQLVTGAIRLRPIGHPTGVRLCNLKDLEPLAINTIGAETWRIFAATCRRDSDIEPRAGTSTAQRYRQYESSGYLGIAYRSA